MRWELRQVGKRKTLIKGNQTLVQLELNKKLWPPQKCWQDV